MICLIYFSVAQFNDNIKFRWRNLNINDLMLINSHILLITKRFFNNIVDNNIVDVISKFHEFSFKIVRVITIVVSNPVNFLVNALL